MKVQDDGTTAELNLTDPKARRSLHQVYMLLLDLAKEAEAPAESAKTRAGASGDRDKIDRQSHDTPGRDEEQAPCPT